MFYLCKKCGNEVERDMKFCSKCGYGLMNNTKLISGWYEKIDNPAERRILYILKRELEEKYPNNTFKVDKTCESYTTLFMNDIGIIRLEKLLTAIDIWFRLTPETKEKYRFTNKFHWYNETDQFWGIYTRETDLSVFDEFIEDAVKNELHCEEITKKRKEKD